MDKSRKSPEVIARFAVLQLQKRLAPFLTLYLILILGILVYATYVVWLQVEKAHAARTMIEQKREYWKEVVAKHKNYPDAHFKLAVYSFQLGDRKIAQEELSAALQLDPGFTQAQNLQKKLK
jgi:tetratricopeptide (TPR) repeat protein